MQKEILLIASIVLFTGCSSEGVKDVEKENINRNIFYVSTSGDNGADGSFSAPWKTIQFAINQLEGKSTLMVKKGIYNEKVLFSQEDDSNIYLKAEIGAIIDGSNLKPIGKEALVGIHNAHHIVIENLELRNFKTSIGIELLPTPIGIFIDGTSHDINITNNNIHHIENLSTCGESSDCGTGANGIAVYGNSQTTMTNLNFIDNEISNCILSSSEAFTINGNIDGFRVFNNHVHDNNNIGIDIIGYESDVCSTCEEEQNRARNGIVKNNRSINNSTNLALGTFNNNPWYEGKDGSAGGFYVDGGHHILFEGNRASQNDLGFEFASEHAGKSSHDILMVNNYIYNNREVGLTIGGYSENPTEQGGGDAKNIMVYNNSFYKNAGWGSEIAFSYRARDISLVNNIIYGEGDVTDNFSEEDNSQSSNINWGKNLWWGKDTRDTSSIQGESIVLDPLYVQSSSGNLDINISSPAIDKGVVQDNISSWSNDFWKRTFIDGVIPSSGSIIIDGKLDMGADGVIPVHGSSYNNRDKV